MKINSLFFQKKFKIETEVENWIQKYDQDMGERQVCKENDILLQGIFCLSLEAQFLPHSQSKIPFFPIPFPIKKGKKKNFVLFVCFVALRPKSTAMVIAGRSVHLTTLFPGQA